MLISRKPVQRREIGKKMRFFRYLPAVTKGLKKVTNLFQIGLFPSLFQAFRQWRAVRSKESDEK